ncbi:alpha/beta fold hydrolase [Cognatiyoonia sp. IB215182]|uniref:alpha/beta fold hydrolase n=1 Tax=Cognatiyoonia sp. IB215182 TaxID=3097353 RepID=UPI002A0FBB82|nr:alpha/beta fold hydrolase [Cognatiyoonia sp. IB215182]MDX8351410.1 alpha/beta fold hydrolase [Cognatiyoonia sp. IB215182]
MSKRDCLAASQISTDHSALPGPAKSLKINVFGELQVVREGAAQQLPPSRKARALLAYLAMTGRPVRRERLCEMLWSIPDDPRASLRWALSRIRKVVDTPESARIQADRERVSIDLSDVEVDFVVARGLLFDNRQTISASELSKIANTLAEPILDGLDDAGHQEFETWLMGEREDARLMQVNALRRLATHADLAPSDRIKWSYKWLDLMPFEVQAATSLIADFRATGRFEEAASVERRFRRETKHAPKDLIADFKQMPATPQPANIEKAPRDSSRRWRLRSQTIGFCKAHDDVNIAYAEVGEGRPLIKAANWLNHLELDWGSPIWGQTFLACAHERRFIRYDSRGNGLSDWNVKDISMESFVADLEAVVEASGVDRFPLLGISQGCAVSIEYAARHPERVSGLVLISGYAAGWRIGATPEEKERREAVMTLTRHGWGTPNPAYRQIFSQTFMPDAKPEELHWFNEFQRQTTSPENAVRFLDAFGDIDVRHRLSQIKCPTIVFHSRDDQRISINQARELAAGIPGAEFVPLHSRNHILLESEPAWQTCLDKAIAFFRKHDM